MKVIAKNSEVLSTLHGVFTEKAGGGIIFSYGFSYCGHCFHDEMTFCCITELTDYLFEVCGYDSVTFKKL